MTTTEINIPFSEASDRHLKIAVGACRLSIHPGSGPAWAKGRYIDPVGILPPRTSRAGGEVHLAQELNPAQISGSFQGLATLELELGRHKPYWLTVESGASEANLDLGGLPLSRLYIKQAASRSCLNFSECNPQALILFQVSVGIGSIEMQNVANANLVEMMVEGGASSCQLDLCGKLQRPALVRLATGLMSVDLSIPATRAAVISCNRTNIEPNADLVIKDGVYWTRAALEARGPRITVMARLAAGALRVRTTPE